MKYKYHITFNSGQTSDVILEESLSKKEWKSLGSDNLMEFDNLKEGKLIINMRNVTTIQEIVIP